MYHLFAAKNTVAVAPHIALEELRLPYEIHWIDFARNEQATEDYHVINPKGRVPALAFDRTTLTETPAILEYLAEISGQLMPSDALARATVREVMSFLASTMHVNHAHKLRGARWSDDPAAHASMKAKVTQNMTNNADLLDLSLVGRTWVSDDYSIADIYIYTVCRWLAGDGVDITNFRNLNAHFQRVGDRPAIQRVEAAHG